MSRGDCRDDFAAAVSRGDDGDDNDSLDAAPEAAQNAIFSCQHTLLHTGCNDNCNKPVWNKVVRNTICC